ncbi:hypothetical protein C8R42DRAFT_721559 [Lentinula raphanica]|nr:hypothetical protein C8R42DRAFT_721559 [Lentinula raphanica]
MLGNVILPSAKSLEFRNNLARLVTPLRRVRPRIPFFQLAAHRVPTLWGLYRGLLRAAPTEHDRYTIGSVYYSNRTAIALGPKGQYESCKKDTRFANSSPIGTATRYKHSLQWFQIFERARGGDVKTQVLLQRYDRFLKLRSEKSQWALLVEKELEWQRHLKNRPILTGGFVHPTLYHPPFPRMKPQPVSISRSIASRMKQRERRFAKIEELTRIKDMIRKEQYMEQGLIREARLKGIKFEPVFEGQDWSGPLADALATLFTNVKTTTARNLRPFSPVLLEQVRRARQNKIVNKTKERERERRGEILRVTRKRWKKGLTPHLLSTMSEKEKREELIVQRSSSEVGYVGLLKKRKGWKLKDPKMKVEGKEWSVEDAEWIGQEEREAATKALLHIQEANDIRRHRVEDPSP